MSFSETGSNPSADETEIVNDGFFPNISPAIARASMRVDGTATPERLRRELIEAMLNVNTQLANWKASQVELGFANLAAVPGTTVDQVKINVHRYLRAVFCYATATINERYRNFDSTNVGNKKADDTEPTIDDLRRDAFWAIKDILGIPRSTIELI